MRLSVESNTWERPSFNAANCVASKEDMVFWNRTDMGSSSPARRVMPESVMRTSARRRSDGQT